MPYLKITDGTPAEYGLDQARRDILAEGISIRRLEDMPEADRDAFLADRGVYPFTQEDRPTIDPTTQTVAIGPFTQAQGGAWSRGWVVSDIPVAEREAEAQAEADRMTEGRRDVDLALAIVDMVLTLDSRNRNNQPQPGLAAVRQGLKDRVLHYARKRRGLT